MAARPDAGRTDRKPLYVAATMTSLSEAEVAAALGPVMLSGGQTLDPYHGFASDRSREKNLTTALPKP
jgi:hypothetical protein